MDRYGTVSSPTQVPSPFHMVGGVATELSVLEDRVLTLANKLVGPFPTSSTGAVATKPPSTEGLFVMLAEAADGMSDRIRRMNEAVAHIEARMP